MTNRVPLFGSDDLDRCSAELWAFAVSGKHQDLLSTELPQLPQIPSFLR